MAEHEDDESGKENKPEELQTTLLTTEGFLMTLSYVTIVSSLLVVAASIVDIVKNDSNSTAHTYYSIMLRWWATVSLLLSRASAEMSMGA